MKIKIRQATKKDVDQIYQVFLYMIKSEDAAFRKTNHYLMKFRQKRDDFETSSKKGIREEIKMKHCKFFVAVVDDKIVGYARGEIKHSPNFFFKKVKTGYLHSLVVMKKYRGKGIASQLHQKMLGWFTKRKCLAMNLSVVNNNPAINIYKKWGYKTFIYKMSKKL